MYAEIALANDLRSILTLPLLYSIVVSFPSGPFASFPEISIVNFSGVTILDVTFTEASRLSLFITSSSLFTPFVIPNLSVNLTKFLASSVSLSSSS